MMAAMMEHTTQALTAPDERVGCDSPKASAFEVSRVTVVMMTHTVTVRDMLYSIGYVYAYSDNATIYVAGLKVEYGVDVTIARLTQTFGPGVVRGDTRVFAQFAEAVLEKRDIVLHTEGRTARCYCYIDDAVSAILTLAEKGASGEAYNVANPETYCTIREMAEMLAAAHPPTRVVVDLSGAAGRGYAPEFRMRLSTAKLEALGWRPHTALLESYERLIDSWREG